LGFDLRPLGYRSFSFRAALSATAAGDGLLQRMNLFGCERADGAGRQFAEAHRADGDAAELLHLMADAGQQAADFAVTAFVQNHFENRRTFTPILDSHVLNVRETFGEVNATLKFAERFALDLAGNLYLVNLLDAVTWMREPVREVAIVGHQDEAFARNVEPADRVDPRRIGRQQVDHTWTSGGVAGRRHDAFGFVYGKVNELRPAQRFAVDADFLSLRIDASAELRHDLMINLDATFENQLFAFAPTGDAGGRENFLQSLAIDRRCAIAVCIADWTGIIARARRTEPALRRFAFWRLAMRHGNPLTDAAGKLRARVRISHDMRR
jgi:hypothetical protein